MRIECDAFEKEIKKHNVTYDANIYCYQNYVPLMPFERGRERLGAVRLLDKDGKVLAKSQGIMIYEEKLFIFDDGVMLLNGFSWEAPRTGYASNNNF